MNLAAKKLRQSGKGKWGEGSKGLLETSQPSGGLSLEKGGAARTFLKNVLTKGSPEGRGDSLK